MDLESFDKVQNTGWAPSENIKKNNTVINYMEEEMKSIEENRSKVECLISKLGKFDEKYITKESNNIKLLEGLSYIIKSVVLIEKIGNENKGVAIGFYREDVNFESQRKQFKEDSDVFNMWVNGEIPGSMIATSQAGFVSNLITNETFYGCSHNWFRDKWGNYDKMLKDI